MKDRFTFRDRCVIQLHKLVSYISSESPSLPFGISFLVCTKDNQPTIQEALDSIADVADEIIIVDSSSVPLKFHSSKSKYFRYRVGEKGWKAFVDKLNFGLMRCSFRWVFKWDADMIGSSLGLKIWKERLRSLNEAFFYEVDVARVNSSVKTKFGDFEGRLFTQHPKVKYRWVPDRDSLVFPFWFRLLRWGEAFIVHKGIKILDETKETVIPNMLGEG